MTTATVTSARGKLRALYRGSSQARWAMASQIVTSGVSFVISVIVIRSLGINEFGRFSVAFLLITILRNFLEGVVLNPLSSIAPKLRGTSARAYRGFVIANGVAFSVSGCLLLLALAVPLGWATGSPWLPEIALPLACVVLTGSMADFFRRYQFVEAKPVRAFSIDAVRFGAQLLFVMLLALLAHDRFNTETLLCALAVANGLAMLLGAMLYGSMAWRRPLNALMWPRHWKFIKWMGPTVALETLINAVPLFAANIILGEAALGLVRVAQQITNILNMPMYALQQVLPSIAATRLRMVGYASMVHLLRRTAYVMAGASIFLGLLVVAASNLIASTMGIADASRFAALLALFMLVNIINAIRFPSMIFVNTVEDPTANFVASGVGVTISIVLSLILIDHLGEIAVPLTIVFIALAIWLTLFLWRRWKYPADNNLLLNNGRVGK